MEKIVFSLMAMTFFCKPCPIQRFHWHSRLWWVLFCSKRFALKWPVGLLVQYWYNRNASNFVSLGNLRGNIWNKSLLLMSDNMAIMNSANNNVKTKCLWEWHNILFNAKYTLEKTHVIPHNLSHVQIQVAKNKAPCLQNIQQTLPNMCWKSDETIVFPSVFSKLFVRCLVS